MKADLCVRLNLTLAVLAFAATQAFGNERFMSHGRASGTEGVEFDVFLPLRNAGALEQVLRDLHTTGNPNYHRWLTPSEFARRFGPSEHDITQVRNSLAAYGLTIAQRSTQSLRVTGNVDAVESAFATSISSAVSATGSRRLIADGRLTLPTPLAAVGAQIAEFRSIVPHQVHGRRSRDRVESNQGNTGPYWATDLKRAYDVPSSRVLTGRGVHIGILMSSDYRDSDITEYFDHENLERPRIIRIRINGGADFDPNSPASVEAEVDIQQAGTMAPQATLTLYTIPDLSDASVLAGYAQIVEENRVDIVTSSFGAFEALYSAEYNNGIDFSDILTVYDNLFKQGNAQGITFVASSGDSGGVGVPPLEYFNTLPTNPPQIVGSFLPGVETPASSPHVTAVGGTNLITSDPMGRGRESTYVTENADGDPLIPVDPYGVGNLLAGGYWGSGGGKSMYYSQPDYQQSLTLTNSGETYRTTPDVSLHMGGCPETALQPCGPDRSSAYVVFAGGLYKVIGTSTSAPAFAGLLALREQLSGRLGNANYFIYQLANEQSKRRRASEKYFHENIPGFNGYYQTQFGYNLVLGIGTVRGRHFILAPDVPFDCGACRKSSH